MESKVTIIIQEMLPLLNNDLANQVVNYIIIGIISLVVWKRREDYLIEMDKV